MLTVGRVRGLAAALGIGAALTVGCGVAWADGDTDAAPAHQSTTSDSAPAASDTKAEKPATDHADAEPKTDSADPAPADEESATRRDAPSRHPEKSDEETDTEPEATAVTLTVHTDEPAVSKTDDPPDEPADEPAAGLVYAAARRESETKHTSVAARTAETVETSEPAGTDEPEVSALSVSDATPKTVSTAAPVANATTFVEQFLYLPIHFVVQAWIHSDIGQAVDGIVNALLGSYVIGNGADGTVDHPDGGAGGWLLGDGGAGWNSTVAGAAGGKGGAAGFFGTGGSGGSGGLGASGGAGGTGGWLMGVGGDGGAGGAGASGGPGGSGGAGGDARSLLLGVGGHGGSGGAGSDGGRGGTGGDGALLLGNGGDGGDAGVSGIDGAATQLPALGGAGGTAGWFGAHGAVGASGSGAITSLGPVTDDDGAALLTISSNGTWLTTGDGQVVVLHGVNEVYKVGSYLPADSGFDDDDAAFLAANGFNVVRLGLIWAGVEPQPGVIDQDYLASIAQTVRTLADHGIYTVLDMHQDLYSSEFGGEGAPVWATQSGGLPNNNAGFPLSYLLNPALVHAWDAFWANSESPTGLGLQDEYARMWEHVAAYFVGNSAVIGYDIMNEPSEGSGVVSSALGSTFAAEQQIAPMYNQVIAAIRAVDPTTAVYVEPSPFTYEIGALLGRPLVMGTIDDPNIVLAVHNYCLGSATAGICGWIAGSLADNAQAYSVEHQIPMFMNEFGASDLSSDLTAGMDAAARYFTSWAVWAYSGKGDITTSGPTTGESLVFDPAQAPTDGNVNTSNLATLSTPYPQVIAGTPNAWSFADGTLTFSYSTEKADGSGPFAAGSQTVISVPAGQFPNGYQVSVTGGHVVPTTGPVLVIASDTGATTVSVVVSGKPAPVQA